MVDDLADGLLRGVFGAVLRFLVWLVAEIFLFYTGELVLYALTLGRRKPRWHTYSNENMTRIWFLTDLNVLVGAVFWLVVVLVTASWLRG